jgi:hypothetical protein
LWKPCYRNIARTGGEFGNKSIIIGS